MIYPDAEAAGMLDLPDGTDKTIRQFRTMAEKI